MHRTAKTAPLIVFLYGCYAWLILLFVVTPVAAACLAVPGVERRRAIARWGAAAVLGLIGSPVRAVGVSIGDPRSSIVVANHSSYLDGIILTAVLPPQYTFLIKREMSTVPIAGFVLRRLGSEFVDRADAHRRHRSARRLVDAARSGHPLAVFPEGTFDERPGLKPFQMGAFRAACRNGLSIIPVVIHGARAKLPGNTWLPRPGPLSVEICPPVDAAGYADEADLVRTVRSTMLTRLDEPDLEADIAPAGTLGQSSA